MPPLATGVEWRGQTDRQIVLGGGLDLGKLKKDMWIKLLGIRTDSSMAGTTVHSLRN